MKRPNENEGGVSDRIGAADTPASPVSALVFKRRHRLQGFLRGPGENEFTVDLRQLAHWYRDIVVPVVNQIRTYWWCSPPRTGRQRMVPATLTARETGASFSKDKCVLISL